MLKNSFKFIIILLFLFLVSCTKKSNITYDDGQIVNGDLELRFGSYSDYSSYYSLSNNLNISIKIINHNPKPYTFSIEKATVIRESNKAEYAAQYTNEIVLECDMEKSISFSASLPTSVSEDNYYLDIKEKHSTYRFYLYETPISQRKDITITYKVDDKIVKEQKIKGGRIFNSLIDYINEDRTKYVSASNWSLDGVVINKNTIINNDIVVESKSSNIFNTYTSSGYTTISGVNFIPKDGILVIPSQINGKTVSISSIGYSDELKELYLPLNFNISYSLSLTSCHNLTKVYYEGTEAEFSKITSGKSIYKNANTVIIYNTSYNG